LPPVLLSTLLAAFAENGDLAQIAEIALIWVGGLVRHCRLVVPRREGATDVRGESEGDSAQAALARVMRVSLLDGKNVCGETCRLCETEWNTLKALIFHGVRIFDQNGLVSPAIENPETSCHAQVLRAISKRCLGRFDGRA
jgi:hypothetical protein